MEEENINFDELTKDYILFNSRLTFNSVTEIMSSDKSIVNGYHQLEQAYSRIKEIYYKPIELSSVTIDTYQDLIKSIQTLHTNIKSYNKEPSEKKLISIYYAALDVNLKIDMITGIKPNSKNVSRTVRADQVLHQLEGFYKESKYLYEEIKTKYEKIKSEIETATDVKNNLERLEQHQRKLQSNYKINNESFKEKLSMIDAAYSKINDFTDEIRTYEIRNEKILKDINSSTLIADEVEKRVSGIEKDLISKQERIDEVLKQAEDIIGKATTADLGRFFKEQYDHSKRLMWIWPAMGFLFLSGAISICIITVFPNLVDFAKLDMQQGNSAEVAFIISRLVISPLFLVGAWFCANQYIKSRNITEDYGHKKVLSLSLISLKAEIEKTGMPNAAEFIRAIQTELFKSPLESLERKHLKKESEFLKAMQFEIMNGILQNAKQSVANDESKHDIKK